MGDTNSRSVGNWSLLCRSHYVVRDGMVHWADSWIEEEVEMGREADRRMKGTTYAVEPSANLKATPPEPVRAKSGIAARIAAWIIGWRS